MVGHLDDQLRGQASELHVQVDGLGRLAEGERGGRRSTSVRRRRRASLCADLSANAIGPPTDFCDNYHAEDPAFWKRVYYWNTPVADCGDDRGDGLQGLQRLGPGVDRDQGVIRGVPRS